MALKTCSGKSRNYEIAFCDPLAEEQVEMEVKKDKTGENFEVLGEHLHKKRLKMMVEPGGFGAKFSMASGKVTDVKDGGKFASLGVCVGWKIVGVVGEPFSKDRIAVFAKGTEEFELEFELPSQTLPGQ